MNKTFELSIDERELMCRMLRYCMVNNADCNFSGGEWLHPEAEKDELAMQDLHDKLKVPKPVQRHGWMVIHADGTKRGLFDSESEAAGWTNQSGDKIVKVHWEE